MCKCSTYIENIGLFFDIFKNITIFSNPDDNRSMLLHVPYPRCFRRPSTVRWLLSVPLLLHVNVLHQTLHVRSLPLRSADVINQPVVTDVFRLRDQSWQRMRQRSWDRFGNWLLSAYWATQTCNASVRINIRAADLETYIASATGKSRVVAKEYTHLLSIFIHVHQTVTYKWHHISHIIIYNFVV